MKKILFLATFIFFVSISSYAQKDSELIKNVIVNGYVHGAFNELNPDAMRKAFHEDFAYYAPNGNSIDKYPIDEWAKRIEAKKASSDFDPKEYVWDHKIEYIDVTGISAQVKIELYHKDELVFTDYLSLLKFDQGWRIVAKVYHKHN